MRALGFDEVGEEQVEGKETRREGERVSEAALLINCHQVEKGLFLAAPCKCVDGTVPARIPRLGRMCEYVPIPF